MQEEIQGLKRNQSWTLVPCPTHANVVGSKQAFKLNYKDDGSLNRFKARLATKGFTQVFGHDYDETFSPIVKPTTIWLIISLSFTHKWTLKQLEVKHAFLHGNLKETYGATSWLQ